MTTTGTELADQLSSLSLFADVGAAELASVAHILDERRFADGERVIRQGVTGSAFYVILAGEATIRVDGKDFGKLGRGDFFGEISVLLGEPPVADIVATRELYCAIIPGPALEPFMLGHPKVMWRVLQNEARKLRTATRWRG